ncbi:MAG: diguanylate cyclase [Desulfovibrionaceae bacterium]|nr:diguanylate cyclase [Desulfovibrionaceae bacterium]
MLYQRLKPYEAGIATAGIFFFLSCPSAFTADTFFASETPSAVFLACLASVILTSVIVCLIYLSRVQCLKKENRELRKTLLRKETNYAAQNRFLDDFSRNVRTPINTILGTADLARRTLPSSNHQITDYLNCMAVASGQILAIASELSDVTYPEGKDIEILDDLFNMNDFASKCRTTIPFYLTGRNLAFECVTDAIVHPEIIGDEMHLHQILLNLIENAVKFTPDNGKITLHISEISAGHRMASFRFEVRDTGIGMTQQKLNSILAQDLRQDDPSDSSVHGTGLGLLIVRELVERLGGSFSAESRLNEGSRFIVEIPFAINLLTFQNKDQSQEIKHLDGINILLVEDNLLNAMMAQEVLEKESASVVLAENGRIALEKFRQSQINFFDAILMDIIMPEMDGFEAARAIRSLERTDAPVVPIVALSVQASTDDIRKSRDAGMNAMLGKPIEIPLLIKTLMQCIQKKSIELSEQLDHSRIQAMRDGLTGVKNRMAYLTAISSLNQKLKRKEVSEFGIIVFDINGLKESNDTRGHTAGDRLIQCACRLICRIFAHSPVFRIGGDEFVVLLLEEDYLNREMLLQQFETSMRTTVIDENRRDYLSVAYGLAVYDKNHPDSESVFQQADANMYARKALMKGIRNVH